MKDLPDHIGHFKILDKLGEGGFATVYLAQPKEQEGVAPVALKVLASQENYGRFRREIETVASLEHPNIIRIYDTGVDEETNVPFYAMEYIPGGTLFDRLQTDVRVSREETVEIIKKIGNALEYPHQRGIIHRDVNPKNILLDNRETPTRPVLTDFGLVKSLGPEAALFTETVALIGTFAYYAPEQWNKEDLGPATDVYALALTFYEMLAGQRPYTGDVFSLREKHLNEPLPPLSQVAPEYGSFFDEVLIKATAKNVGDRFQTVSTFIQAIENANKKAEEAAVTERRECAVSKVKAAQELVQGGDYDHRQVLETLELVLEDYPDYAEALWLRGKMQLEQGQFLDALPDFELAQQTSTLDTAKKQDYLQALQQAAKSLWQSGAYSDALRHLETIQKMISNGLGKDETVHAWKIARLNLVQTHYEAGLAAYADGEPEDVHQAVNILKQEIEALTVLEADTECEVLHDLLRQLQIKDYYTIGLNAFADGKPEQLGNAIDKLQSTIRSLQALDVQEQREELEDKLKILQVKHHHATGVAAFNEGEPEDLALAIETLAKQQQALQSLEAPKEAEDLRNKVDRLQAKMLYQDGLQAFADGASQNPETAITILEQTIAALRSFEADDVDRDRRDLSEKLRLLQAKERQDEKYDELQTLIEQEQFSEALACLDKEFIRTGQYHYKDTAQLLSRLMYAEQYNELPSEVSISMAQKIKKQYELNRYLIPLSLSVALFAGPLIFTQIIGTPLSPVISGIAAVLVVVYLGYYGWVYYIER